MKTMAFKVIDQLYVVVYGDKNPTDAEWGAYLGNIEGKGFERTKQLVWTLGGGPTPVQRKLLNDKLGGREVAVAVMSSSVAVRGTITALGWFNSKIKAFPMNGLHEALAYLEIPDHKFAIVENELKKLRVEIGHLGP